MQLDGREGIVGTVAGLFEQGLGGLGVEVVPLIAGARVRDGAGGEVIGDFGAGRVEVVDDALAVDGLGKGLADQLIVERSEGIVHADVHDVQGRAGDQLEVGIALDGLEIIRTDVVDAVHRAGLQLEQALRRLSAPAEHQGTGLGLFTPVVFELLEDELVAAFPLSHIVRAGADRLLKQIALAAGRGEILAGLDGEGGEGDLRGEGRVRRAERDLDGEFVHRFNGLDLATVVTIRSFDLGGSKSLFLQALGLDGGFGAATTGSQQQAGQDDQRKQNRDLAFHSVLLRRIGLDLATNKGRRGEWKNIRGGPTSF